MIKITAAQIAEVHQIIQTTYPNGVTSGRVDQSKLDSIAEKPFTKVYGHAHYDTIFKQAACLMEGIIRLHPFTDGNKRTALLATYAFLLMNKNYMAIPLDVVRFMVNVAQDDIRTEEEADELNNHMADWLEKEQHQIVTSLMILHTSTLPPPC